MINTDLVTGRANIKCMGFKMHMEKGRTASYMIMAKLGADPCNCRVFMDGDRNYIASCHLCLTGDTSRYR
jgi:hypothetical protein